MPPGQFIEMLRRIPVQGQRHRASEIGTSEADILQSAIIPRVEGTGGATIDKGFDGTTTGFCRSNKESGQKSRKYCHHTPRLKESFALKERSIDPPHDCDAP